MNRDITLNIFERLLRECTCRDVNKNSKNDDDEILFDEGDEDLNQVTPPGGEKVVRALKKNSDVDNPWAVAWSMKNKGYI